MKALFFLSISLLFVACSSKPEKPVDIVAEQQAGKDQDAIVYDTEKPTNFDEYKRWRAKNDPASEAYAEFKEWEINQRRWKQEQQR